MMGTTIYGPDTGRAHVTLAWWRGIKGKLGRVVLVEMADFRERSFPLKLRDDRNNIVYLAGVTSGYFGTGSRATAEVLRDAGFTADWVFAYPMERQAWRLTRAEYLRTEASHRGFRVVRAG